MSYYNITHNGQNTKFNETVQLSEYVLFIRKNIKTEEIPNKKCVNLSATSDKRCYKYRDLMTEFKKYIFGFNLKIYIYMYITLINIKY